MLCAADQLGVDLVFRMQAGLGMGANGAGRDRSMAPNAMSKVSSRFVDYDSFAGTTSFPRDVNRPANNTAQLINSEFTVTAPPCGSSSSVARGGASAKVGIGFTTDASGRPKTMAVVARSATRAKSGPSPTVALVHATLTVIHTPQPFTEPTLPAPAD
jgi:hypothetical protein